MNIISLGLGQQSTAIYFMSSFGDLPRADYAIFADPKAEKKETYEYLKWLLQWQKDNNGIPIGNAVIPHITKVMVEAMAEAYSNQNLSITDLLLDNA